MNPHELAELILSQPLIGTTVKADGKQSDPYAFLTVVNMHVHKVWSSFIFSLSPDRTPQITALQDNPSIKAITEYVLSKSAPDPTLHNTLQSILAPDAGSHVGFIFSERLINMPIEVVPHMYRMLADEIQWACDDGEPYHFGHFLMLSRTYILSGEEADAMLTLPQQKRRKGAPAPSAARSVSSFHHEDSFIQQVSLT